MPDVHPSPADARARLVGIALICLAVVCFTLLDTTAKWLGMRLDTLQVVWARFAGHFVLSLIALRPWRNARLLRARRPGLQLIRSALLLGATTFNFTALRFLQLDQASAIMFTAPLLVAALSGPMLGERIDGRRWLAIGCGFAGVLVVTRPGGGIHPAAAFSLLAASCTALYSITTRMLAPSDSSETTAFYSSVAGLVAASVPVVWVWAPPQDGLTLAGLAAVGAFGWIGHWLLIVAHRYAPAPVLAPFSYAQMLWMTLAGLVVFGDRPDRWTLAGAAIVILSGLYLLVRERPGGGRSEKTARSL